MNQSTDLQISVELLTSRFDGLTSNSNSNEERIRVKFTRSKMSSTPSETSQSTTIIYRVFNFWRRRLISAIFDSPVTSYNHKLQSLICFRSALTYINTTRRRIKMRRHWAKHPSNPEEDFSEINQELKLRIFKFVIVTLNIEMNEKFREFLNDILFIILKEGSPECISVFTDSFIKIINTSAQTCEKFGQQLLSRQKITGKIRQ